MNRIRDDELLWCVVVSGLDSPRRCTERTRVKLIRFGRAAMFGQRHRSADGRPIAIGGADAASIIDDVIISMHRQTDGRTDGPTAAML